MHNDKLILFLSLLPLLFATVELFHISLEKVSTLYLPYSWTSTEDTFSLHGAAEQAAVDTKAEIIYAVGHNNLFVIDMSDLTHLKVMHRLTLGANRDIADVEQCGQYVVIGVDDNLTPSDGYINIYSKYNLTTKRIELLHTITVGALPDMVLPTKDCRTIVVAIEGSPKDSQVDPPGGVGIIELDTANISKTPSYTLLDFVKFNNKFEELAKSGVRFVNRENNTFSNEVEPEYITMNENDTKAYISLQENNAIAVVDLETKNITGVYGLGFKNWSTSALDASDKDDGFNMEHWPVLGMYQPDSIKHVTINHRDYIITANEGDAFDSAFFAADARVKDVTLGDEFGNSSDRMRLQTTANLGRLEVSKVDGKTANDSFSRLYTYGGRSFSLWAADDMSLVYDSGNTLGTIIHEQTKLLFNSDGSKHDRTVVDSTDTRSDNKGSEPESIAKAMFGKYLVIFIGNERPGIISIHSIDTSLPVIEVKHEGIFHDIPLDKEGATWRELYQNREVSALDPEDIIYIEATNSQNKKPFLVIIGSASGTVTVANVNVEMETKDTGEPAGTTPTSSSLEFKNSVTLYLVLACLLQSLF